MAAKKRPTTKKATASKAARPAKAARKSKPRAQAKTRARASNAAKPPSATKRRTSSAAAPPRGPVTLEEALALAQARAPRRTLRRAAVTEPTDTKELADTRQELQKARKAERERRKREYRDVIKIMKKRGARAAPAKVPGAPGRRAVPLPTKSFDPLQIFAEGDSWFDYPVPFMGGGIIPMLQFKLGVPILNLADPGDEVRFMLGVKQRKRLIEAFDEGSPGGGPWDLMLFSGGGNDIVDNPMALWIRDWDANANPAQLINQPRLDAALALVRAGYEDLISLRDALSPATHIIFHGYDYAIPDGRGVCGYGPWLKPTFDLRGFPSLPSRFAVVKEMLKQFAAMLTTLAASNKNVTLINTQGTLPEKTDSWHNELHPDKKGFRTMAEKFRGEIARLFPQRIA